MQKLLVSIAVILVIAQAQIDNCSKYDANNQCASCISGYFYYHGACIQKSCLSELQQLTDLSIMTQVAQSNNLIDYQYSISDSFKCLKQRFSIIDNFENQSTITNLTGYLTNQSNQQPQLAFMVNDLRDIGCGSFELTRSLAIQCYLSLEFQIQNITQFQYLSLFRAYITTQAANISFDNQGFSSNGDTNSNPNIQVLGTAKILNVTPESIVVQQNIIDPHFQNSQVNYNGAFLTQNGNTSELPLLNKTYNGSSILYTLQNSDPLQGNAELMIKTSLVKERRLLQQEPLIQPVQINYELSSTLIIDPIFTENEKSTHQQQTPEDEDDFSVFLLVICFILVILTTAAFFAATAKAPKYYQRQKEERKSES